MLDMSLSLSLRVPNGAPVITISSGTGYAGSVYRVNGSGGQWQADGVAIAGATGQEWTMTTGYEGAAITCRVGGKDSLPT